MHSVPRKVLIVEDVVLIRITTTDMVEEIGYGTVEAGSGEEALVVLRDDPAVSILLTDLGLPGMSGNQLIERALKMNPHLKIVIASGSEQDADGTSPNVVRLMKPFGIEQLRRALSD